MQDALYQARILDHAKNPRNKRVLLHATHEERASNPSCGDTLTLYLQVREGVVQDVSFLGEGCAISQAAASLLTEKLKGHTTAEAMALTEQDVFDILGISVGIARQKCALLAWRALQNAACRDV